MRPSVPPSTAPAKLASLKVPAFAHRFRELATASHSAPRRITFFLGAGASVSSGIPTGGQLLAKWQSAGLTTQTSYLSAIEELYPTRSERNTFFTSLIKDPKCQPSSGYLELARLRKHLAPVLDIVLTTNFDNLIERAADGASVFPCWNHSLAGHAFSQLERGDPILVKLHGDCRTDDTGHTLEEMMQALHAPTPFAGREPVAVSIADLVKKILQRYKPHYLVFVGYSGSDQNVADLMRDLSEKGHIEPRSVFWCSSQEPDDSSCKMAPWLRSLGATWVELPNNVGFDGLMKELVEATGAPLHSLPITRDAVEQIYLSYDSIPWARLFRRAHKLDVYCDYLSSWLDEQSEHLAQLIRDQKPVNFYFPASENQNAMGIMRQRFPDKILTIDEAKGKVAKESLPRIAKLYEKIRTEPNFKGQSPPIVNKTDAVFNFTMHDFGDDRVLLSIYEHDRQKKIGSPALLLNLSKSAELRSYVEKELKYLKAKSRPHFIPGASL